MNLTPSTIEQIRHDWQNASFGAKTTVVDKWAESLGCSNQKLYRLLDIGRHRKKGDYKIDGLKEATEILAQVKKNLPKDAGELSTDQALKIAVDNGLIPKSMEGVCVSTFDRVMRDLELNKRTRRVQRFQALYPNQLHHHDASSSEFFYVARKLPDGDYVLKLHMSSKGYKNKPVPIRLRPWAYGLTDDYSGYFLGRYTVAEGESMIDSVNFLEYAWKKNGERPFFGVPDRIKCDHGPLGKGHAAKEWLDRLGVEKEKSVPYRKEAHGKVERPWRTVWQRFERPFLAQSDWKNFEITLSELNRRFMIFLLEDYNESSHRYETDITRFEVWQRINLHGGARDLPENAIATLARRESRKVGADGCFSLDGVVYEVPGLHDAWVWVYQSISDGRLVVENKSTGEKYPVETFAPAPLDQFKGHRDTPHQKAVKAASNLDITNTLYDISRDQGSVVPFPVRVKEICSVRDPFDVNTYPSLNAAMQAFISLSGRAIDKEDYEFLADLFVENGLSRGFVREAAVKVQRVEKERRYGYG